MLGGKEKAWWEGRGAWEDLGVVRFTHLLSVVLNSWKGSGKETKSVII